MRYLIPSHSLCIRTNYYWFDRLFSFLRLSVSVSRSLSLSLSLLPNWVDLGEVKVGQSRV